MQAGKLVNASDGLPGLVVGSWAKEKLYYVQRYCRIFSTGMKGRWKNLVYIDLYCGPGKGVLEQLRYKEFKDYVLVRHPSNQVPLYHLVFAAKHPRGGEFWDKIGRKTPYGQFRLFKEVSAKYCPSR